MAKSTASARTKAAAVAVARKAREIGRDPGKGLSPRRQDDARAARGGRGASVQGQALARDIYATTAASHPPWSGTATRRGRSGPSCWTASRPPRRCPRRISSPSRACCAAPGGEALLRVAGLQDALAELKKLKRPFLNWAGKAERLSFEVPTMPLFVHERLSTSAIIETLAGAPQAARAEPGMTCSRTRSDRSRSRCARSSTGTAGSTG